MPRVSVVRPPDNCGRCIGDAIDSILAQTRVPDQIIIVNDGSADNTADVVGLYRDPRIVYLEQKNGGISSARNRGLSVATGDYIGFLDADDRWLPTMLEKQLAVLERERDVICIFANFMRVDERTQQDLGEQFRYYPLHDVPTVPGPINDSHVIASDAFCELASFNEIPCYVQVTLFRTAAIAGMRFKEHLRLGEDYEFLMRVYLRGRVAYNTEVLAVVRRHDHNATNDYSWAPVSRLQALQEIGDAVNTREQRAAYTDRLVKAHIDAAGVHCHRRSFVTGLSTFRQGLVVPGSFKRKVKGALRLAWVSCGAVIALPFGSRR
jgi:glycosyltransferase involved in cell wall biosynthesis